MKKKVNYKKKLLDGKSMQKYILNCKEQGLLLPVIHTNEWKYGPWFDRKTGRYDYILVDK